MHKSYEKLARKAKLINESENWTGSDIAMQYFADLIVAEVIKMIEKPDGPTGASMDAALIRQGAESAKKRLAKEIRSKFLIS